LIQGKNDKDQVLRIESYGKNRKGRRGIIEKVSIRIMVGDDGARRDRERAWEERDRETRVLRIESFQSLLKD